MTTGDSAPPAPGLSFAETIDVGDLVDPEVRAIAVDGPQLLVAFVDEPDARARGLMGVEDLGELDGMLFDLETERVHSFTMRNTLIPLDIYFFEVDGSLAGSLTMEPCAAEPCPSYSIGAPSRFALEVPQGSVEVAMDARLANP